ncbi:unnamed protein product, partial [Ixodes pacificus]
LAAGPRGGPEPGGKAARRQRGGPNPDPSGARLFSKERGRLSRFRLRSAPRRGESELERTAVRAVRPGESQRPSALGRAPASPLARLSTAAAEASPGAGRGLPAALLRRTARQRGHHLPLPH